MEEKKIKTPVGEFVIEDVQSPPDERDHIAETIFPPLTQITLPSSLDLRKDLQDVRNQGSQGSCSAQAAACMKEWQEKKDPKVKIDGYMSPQFIYNNRANQNSAGMYARNTMDILLKFGDCLENCYPYGTIQKKEEIPQKAYENAKHFKIQEYAKISTIDTSKTALYKNGPCYFSVPVYNHSTRMWKPEPNQRILGGHAMAIVGYNSQGFIIRNSWGENWGEKGYCIFPYEDWGMHWETWTTIDADSSKPDVNYNSWWWRLKRWFRDMWKKYGLTMIFVPVFVITLIVATILAIVKQ